MAAKVTTLRDLGERGIIDDILRPRYSLNVVNFGDDCASLKLGSTRQVLVTTDPCPTPVATLLGFSDYYYWGWLLATINLSDLAAAGADPAGLVTSLILPSDMAVDDFERLLTGIDDSCVTAGTSVIGGNLKEGREIALTGTAIGYCDGTPMSRSGATSGQMVVVIGDIGNFWAGYFAATRGLPLSGTDREFLMRNILKPTPKVAIGRELRTRRLMSTCIDNSDGLYPSLISLARINSVRIQLDFSHVSYDSAVEAVARQLGVQPIRLALGWGDWQLVGSASAQNVSIIEDICSQAGLHFSVIGRVTTGAGVHIFDDEKTGPLMALDSQRFAEDSWFETGIETYAAAMLNNSLIGNQSS